MQDDLAQAARDSGIPTEAFQHWLMNDSEQALMRLPSVGRIREVTHRRLANADDSWERNDLYDMLFLSTAAGYADFVVGERKIGNYLRQAAATTPPGGQVFVKMADAFAAIETELAVGALAT
ncbi:hypothetical protein [Phytoactinopolyspora endophytica]|uniref:hypothetical protein n=1 Tax=Phytoactinopolyspora endophytica TaxID=1642495 RepID=UPI0013EB3376|nr:hypothetical protein [Phytoactinopolyspora endophytica]